MLTVLQYEKVGESGLRSFPPLQKVDAEHRLWNTISTPIFYIACWAPFFFNFSINISNSSSKLQSNQFEVKLTGVL